MKIRNWIPWNRFALLSVSLSLQRIKFIAFVVQVLIFYGLIIIPNSIKVGSLLWICENDFQSNHFITNAIFCGFVKIQKSFTWNGNFELGDKDCEFIFCTPDSICFVSAASKKMSEPATDCSKNKSHDGWWYGRHDLR